MKVNKYAENSFLACREHRCIDVQHTEGSAGSRVREPESLLRVLCTGGPARTLNPSYMGLCNCMSHPQGLLILWVPLQEPHLRKTPLNNLSGEVLSELENKKAGK